MVSVVLCSIDSFLAALSIGLLGCSEISRQKLIVAFAACDLGATLAGTSLRAWPQIHHGGLSLSLAPIGLAFVAAAVLAHSRKFPASFLWLPVLLSLDNFIGCLLDGSAPGVQSPLIAGLASGLLAWSGFAASRLIGALFSKRSAFMVSVSLLISAFVFAN